MRRSAAGYIRFQLTLIIVLGNSAGDISSFRSHADRNAQITFLLPPTFATEAYEVARELINSSLERSMDWAKRPVHLLRPVIALYQALLPSAKPAMLTEAFEEVDFHHYGADTNLEEDTSNGPSDRDELVELLRDGSRKMVYILEWLIVSITSVQPLLSAQDTLIALMLTTHDSALRSPWQRETRKLDSHNKSALARYKNTKVLEEAKILSHWLPRQQRLIMQGKT